MDRRITVVFVLLTFLILPSTASMEAGMNPSIFEEGCACHGEPSEGDDPLEIRHFLIQSDASTGGFIPGETYTGRIHVLGPGLNESNSNNTVFHLIATDGELNFGSAFQSHSDVMQNAIKHNDTWLSTNQSANHEWWDIEWTAPANITDYRPVNLTLYGMRANGDGVPNDAGQIQFGCMIINRTIRTPPTIQESTEYLLKLKHSFETISWGPIQARLETDTQTGIAMNGDIGTGKNLMQVPNHWAVHTMKP